MGIHGIYKEIGPGERVALSKFAANHFEATGRPLRLAIDTSIWLFQIQSGKGGTNPALRTFYYRLLRMISLSIQPLFVFDGPNKPPFKRSKRTGPNVASIPEFLAKQLLKQFGFPLHVAPGEAEAECALLQREGVVDAVLSEDVDTLMFGSKVTIRNWSSNDKNKTPTHINLYEAEKTKSGASGLDREGMILVALMSGGDYVPEGIPGIGPKVACEAARAGFGAELCKIRRQDKNALREWRDRLSHELHTNESKFFRTKHAALKIPEDFPRSDILGYYTHPAVSSSDRVQELRGRFVWDQDFEFSGLRSFAGDAFDWRNVSGAKKFVRNLAPALLVKSLRLGSDKNFIQGIHQVRRHQSTDELPELRVSYIPMELVDIDLDAEDPDDEIAQDEVDDDAEADSAETEAIADGTKPRGPYLYDPTKVDKVWIPEVFVKHGAPALHEEWVAKLSAPKKTAKKSSNAKKASKSKTINNQMLTGAMNQFVQVTKPFRASTPTDTAPKTFRDQQLPFRASQTPCLETPRTSRTQKFPAEEPISILSSPAAETNTHSATMADADFAAEADPPLANPNKATQARSGSPTPPQRRNRCSETGISTTYISLLSSPASSTPRKGATPQTPTKRTPRASEKTPAKTPSRGILSYFSPSRTSRDVHRESENLDSFSDTQRDTLSLAGKTTASSQPPPPPAFRKPTRQPLARTLQRYLSAPTSVPTLDLTDSPPSKPPSRRAPCPNPKLRPSASTASHASPPPPPPSQELSCSAPSPGIPPDVLARRKRQRVLAAARPGGGSGTDGARSVGGVLAGTGHFRVRKSLPGAFEVMDEGAVLEGKGGWCARDVHVLDLTGGR